MMYLLCEEGNCAAKKMAPVQCEATPFMVQLNWYTDVIQTDELRTLFP